MKNTIIISLLSVFILTGCSKDFIDREPVVGTTEATFYQTEQDAIFAINSAYSSLQFEMSSAGHFRWFWGDIMSDDSTKGGSGDNDVFPLLQLETFQGPTNTDLLEAEWRADYVGVYRANVVLDKIPDMDIDADLKERILGEAKFIRAYFYYQLVTIFGDAPLITRPLAPSEYEQSRAAASEIWALIDTDLTEAAASLPHRSEYAAEDLGRITKGAAQGLLMRALMFRNDFTAVQALGQQIIDSGEYTLAPDYATIFLNEGENGPGSIFEIQYMNGSGGNWGYHQQNEGTFTNVFQNPRGAFEGYGFNIPTQSFVDEFEPGDPRLAATVIQEGDFLGDRGEFSIEAAGGFGYLYHPRKYYSNASDRAPIGAPEPNGFSNDRVIRYADVLLMTAEAAYHTGDEAKARTLTNEVRARARNTATNPQALLPIGGSGQLLLDKIYHERRVELGLEGHRFFDLVRQGRAAEVMGSLGFQAGTHELFPVPESQIQATNGAITQNPGY
jgi:hypothetical protein